MVAIIFFRTLTVILRWVPPLPQRNLGAMGPREVDQFNSVTQPGVWTPEPRSPSSQRCMSVLGLGVVCEVPAQPSPSLHLLPAWRKCERKLWLPLLSAGPPSQSRVHSTHMQAISRDLGHLKYCSDPHPRNSIGVSPCVSSRNNRITSLALMGALRSGLDEVHKHRTRVPNLLASGCLSFLQSTPALLFPMPTPLIPVRTDFLPSTHFKPRN